LAAVNRDGTGSGNGTASLVNNGGYTPGPGGTQVLSADGRYLVFDGNSTDLVAATATGQNVFLRDLRTGITTLVSFNTSGSGPGGSSGGIISPDGRFVAFKSSQKLLGIDTNTNEDVYVYN